MFSFGTTTNSYRRIDIPDVKNIILSNDGGTNVLGFSLDGSTLAGFLNIGEVFELQDIDFDTIFINSYVANNHTTFRLWGWGKRELKIKSNEVFPNDKNKF